MPTDDTQPMRAQLASRLRWMTTLDWGIPPFWKLEKVLGFSEADYVDAWGSWQEALAGIQPHSPAAEAEVGTPAERFRHRCPHGHMWWAPRDGYFVCTQCECEPDIVAEPFEHLIERSTDQPIHYEEFIWPRRR